MEFQVCGRKITSGPVQKTRPASDFLMDGPGVETDTLTNSINTSAERPQWGALL